ncbi:GTP 3',8-cyclase MoaA [Croceivirga radicis]|uniref:GTP 3',8-cyclase MoaA n=1 Tax=Croceivirga radicis TaxID=1929488 RepID=UPI0002DACCCB|nr:GTP 3',8-cyclase MoaA [Croceivirga radicis]
MLIDNHNRVINYLRLAVTDRCNLRCNYCMPSEGINFVKKDKLLSIDELKRVALIAVEQGIEKIRITGGEPFVRKDVMELLRYLSNLDGLKDISITTNATLIGPYIQELKELGITNINVSLDAIEKATFERITRRKQFETVYGNLVKLINEGFNVRINFIVLENQNEGDILSILDWFKNYPVSIRFLEEMPFNGGTKGFSSIKWNYKAILEHIRTVYPNFNKLEVPVTATAINYQIEGHTATFGIIPSFSRTFCGSCNRLRITATGDIITCLYGKPKANLRTFLRNTANNSEIGGILKQVISNRAKTGFEAQEEHSKVFDNSMTSIGG